MSNTLKEKLLNKTAINEDVAIWLGYTKRTVQYRGLGGNEPAYEELFHPLGYQVEVHNLPNWLGNIDDALNLGIDDEEKVHLLEVAIEMVLSKGWSLIKLPIAIILAKLEIENE